MKNEREHSVVHFFWAGDIRSLYPAEADVARCDFRGLVCAALLIRDAETNAEIRNGEKKEVENAKRRLF